MLTAVALIAAADPIPWWVSAPLGFSTIVAVLFLGATGQICWKRELDQVRQQAAIEIESREKLIAALKENHALEVEARQAAERAAAHVIEQGATVVALIEALRLAVGREQS